MALTFFSAFNSFTGFHRWRLVVRSSTSGWLSIPSPDSTRRKLRPEIQNGLLTFNSFTGFHRQLLQIYEILKKGGFQFLHRIPPADQGGGVEIPIPGLELSIPSPDSTFDGGERPLFVGEGVFQFLHRIPLWLVRDWQPYSPYTFNSFTGFHMLTQPGDSGSLVVSFQFLHRIPPIFNTSRVAEFCAFNSFTGFHRRIWRE